MARSQRIHCVSRRGSLDFHRATSTLYQGMSPPSQGAMPAIRSVDFANEYFSLSFEHCQ
jgi:hypothetical protein